VEILRLNLNKAQTDLPTEAEIQFHVAFLASISALVASFVARFLFDAPLMPELLAQFFFAIAPIWMVEVAVGMLGPFAKHLAFLGCTVIYLIALIAAVAAFLHIVKKRDSSSNRVAFSISFSIIIWIVTMTVVLPALGGGAFGSHLRQGASYTSITLFIVHLIYGVAIVYFSRRYIDKAAVTASVVSVISRRRLVRGVGYSVLAVGVYDIGKSLIGSWLQSGSGRVKHGNGEFPNIDNLALEITPNKDFYQVSKNAFDPQVDVHRWKLEVTGLVENPIAFTLDDLKSFPSIEQHATLACISNEVGGDLIGNALWKGVRLKDVLERAGLREGVIDVALHASDDYIDSIPLERAMANETLLVYEMNGEPLTPEHGFPIRLLVPGIYGMKNVKWITRIEPIAFDLKGYWQRRGWDDRAEYKTLSRIDAPDGSFKDETSIAGIAFAGDRGISKVEVSTDGGATWEEANVRSPLSPLTWVLWEKRWKPAQSGKHRIVVRATDGRNQTQTSQYAPPAPSGSSGYHSVIISSD
jgi:DMSO/TMAO reductase YedYZ molybdopterin-dependent catalytic subunit